MEVLDLPACLLSKIDFDKTNSFSKSFLDYISGNEKLKEFHNGLPTKENLRAQIDKRNFNDSNRSKLHEVLKKQYEGLEISEVLSSHLNLLENKTTFTITTGHQLNIFTGPLYFIYKIVTVIKACKEMKESYPEFDFVPIYWMASEDHDFDEISYFRYGGKKFQWQTEQTGAVGHFNPKELKGIIEEFPGIPVFFQDAYQTSKTLAEAVRKYVNHLFGDSGLVVIDADDKRCKSLFRDVINADIFDHIPHQKVSKTSTRLNDLGYKAQVYPREINFFYLKGNIRNRIEIDGNKYAVVDTDITFSKEEIQKEIDEYPERFSPNVVLRPLYQEYLLPNLAYVGGPSELVYWLQLKDNFDHFHVRFPLLMPRNFGAVLDKRTLSKIEKAQLSFEDLFKNELDLVNDKVAEETQFDLDLSRQKQELKRLFDQALEQAKSIDNTLERTVHGEHRKAEKSLEKIEKKLLKAERKNQEVLVNRIYSIKEVLFPEGAPQERKDNFLNFFLNDPNFIHLCLESFDPFDYRFHLISTNE
jgi:bacillithiol biosynthesis cysteine-adding enzyme BshC